VTGYGTELANACVAAGTDYVDLTGEVLFARTASTPTFNATRRSQRTPLNRSGSANYAVRQSLDSRQQSWHFHRSRMPTRLTVDITHRTMDFEQSVGDATGAEIGEP